MHNRRIAFSIFAASLFHENAGFAAEKCDDFLEQARRAEEKRVPEAEEKALKSGMAACPDEPFDLLLGEFYRDRKQNVEAVTAFSSFLKKGLFSSKLKKRIERACLFLKDEFVSHTTPFPESCRSIIDEISRSKQDHGKTSIQAIAPAQVSASIPDRVALTLNTDLPGTRIYGLPGHSDGLSVTENTVLSVKPADYLLTAYMPPFPEIQKNVKARQANSFVSFTWESAYKEKYGDSWHDFKNSGYLPGHYKYRKLAFAGRYTGLILASVGITFFISAGIAKNLTEKFKNPEIDFNVFYGLGSSSLIVGSALSIASFCFPRSRPNTNYKRDE